MAATPSSSADPAPPLSTSPSPLAPRTFISTPILPLPSHFASQSILGRPPAPPTPAPAQPLLYAAARAFPPRHSAVARAPHAAGDRHVVTVANPAGYIRNSCPTAVLTLPAAAVQARPLGFSPDHGAHQMYHHQRHPRPLQAAEQTRQLQQLHAQQAACLAQFAISRQARVGGVLAPPAPDSAPLAAAAAPPSKAVAVAAAAAAAAVHPKVTSFQAAISNPEFSNLKDSRDKNREDGVVLVNGRKVRLSESPSGSLYALCRSWVQNGLPQEIQPSFGDGVKLLPRPLPLKVAEAEDDDPEKEESAESIDNLSAGDLLQRHVMRAKRVRARLREKRLQRIERYKQRLSLLLPLPIEQCRSDATPGG